MDKTQPIHQTCPNCQTNRGYLRAVAFSELVKTLSFRCDGCGATWDVATDVPVADRLTLGPRQPFAQGLR